jgi:beta-glucosidase-like glycosyl hydrolase/CubicO group peptidase (beta-lactamase class C family)
MKKSHSIYLLILLSLSWLTVRAQNPAFTGFLNDPWVNARLDEMTLQEKIGQLVMIEVYPDQSELHRGNIEKLLRQYKPGGILMMRGTPAKTARWIREFQKNSVIPLLVAMDAESGPAFRLDSILPFPNAQATGAIRNDSLLYRMGRAVGRQLRELGISMNFAPVADINTNPANPIINFRAFGEEKMNVARKSLAYAQGMQFEKVAAVAKHFPGHGDTRSDSHLTLPVIRHSMERLDSVELMPFRYLAEHGISGIMTGHVGVPSIDPSGRPASLSELAINQLLRQKIGYQGLIITDAMNMKGVTLPSGQAEVQALKAGNDMVEFVTSLSGTISAIEHAVKTGSLTIQEIDQKCRRILAMKRWLDLHNYKPNEPSDITARLNSPENELVARELTEASLTVLRNRDNLLPLMRLDTLRIATVSINGGNLTPFQNMVSRYGDADHFQLSGDASSQEISSLVQRLKSYNLVIAGVHGLRSFPGRSYGVSSAQSEAIKLLAQNTRLVTLFFGNAYALRFFNGIELSAALILAYQDNVMSQELSVQMLFGAIDATGRIPVTPDGRFRAGTGIDVKKNGRLKFTIPEEAGISSVLLIRKIDSIAIAGLKEKAYPGAQVLIARNGRIILQKSYGHLTYDRDEPVTPDKVYDWASVTKVSGPLPALMKLTGEGKFNLNRTISYYWPDLKGSNKENILIRDILTHQARLRPIIPLWQSKFARDPGLRNEVFKNQPFRDTDIRVSSNLYMDKSYVKAFYDEIRESTLLPRKSYTYTCVGFHLWPVIIEGIVKQPYEEYLKASIYRPLGATSITYNAWKHYPQSRIAPTEADDYFRMETLRGFVHDEGAAILGGISGNAGLFGTAGDLAKLFQMYLWDGYYGGEQIIPEGTVKEFTKIQFPGNNNRRGLGFDKPDINNHLKKQGDAYPAASVSPNSFGHSGYTGTFVWADPDSGILFILLTNRVHPTRNNNKLSHMGIRGDMLQAIYDSRL